MTLVATVHHTIDLAQQRLQIAGDVRVWPVRERGELAYRIEIPSTHRFFRIGYRESYLCSLLDGETTLAQACSITAARLGRDAPTSSESVEIAKWLLQNQIAHLAGSPPPVRDQRERSPRNEAEHTRSLVKLFGRVNPFWMKLPIPGAGRIVGVLSGWVAPLLSMPVIIAACLVIVSALCVIATRPELFFGGLPDVLHPSRWVLLLCTWMALKVIHEMGHAVACYRCGCEVHRCGVVLVLFAPLAYVDVTSCWRLPSRWSRMGVSVAGMFVECCVAAIAVWWIVLSDDPWVDDLCYNVVVTAGLSTLLFNANVLMRFDGYYILADAIEIPNLAAEASSFLRSAARRWIVGQRCMVMRFDGWRGVFVGLYAACSLVWRVSVGITLAVTAATLFHGGGILIAGIGIAVGVNSAGSRLSHYLKDLRRDDPIRFYRALVVGGGAIAVVCLCVFVLPVPSRVRAPVLTRFAAAASVRAPASGIIECVDVADGQFVDRSTSLVRIQNAALVCTLKELEIEAQRMELEWMQASQEHNEGRCQVLRRGAELLEQRIDPIRQRVQSLHVRSEQAGTVIAKDLASLVGTYVNEGDELMIVAGPGSQEWVTLIEPQQIESIRSAVGSRVRLTAPDGSRFESKIARIEPRATDRLSEPALASINGGPLAIRGGEEGDDSEHLRLVQPHFYAWLNDDELENAAIQSLPVGIRMHADCGYQTQTIASRLSQWIREMVDRQTSGNESTTTGW